MSTLVFVSWSICGLPLRRLIFTRYFWLSEISGTFESFVVVFSRRIHFEGRNHERSARITSDIGINGGIDPIAYGPLYIWRWASNILNTAI